MFRARDDNSAKRQLRILVAKAKIDSSAPVATFVKKSIFSCVWSE